MATLRTARRNKLPKSDFGLPGQRKYPMPDKEHARVAKAYASKEESAGKLSSGGKAEIDAKADRVLGKRAGGRKGRGSIMESHGNGPAPRNDAAGASKGFRGGGKNDGELMPKMPESGRGSRDGKDKATAANQAAAGGGSHGKGGIASHPNMASMHGDGCMYKERY